MNYEAWRISFQDPEQAAKAAYEEAQRYKRMFNMAINSIVELTEAAGIPKENQLTGGNFQALNAIEKLKERREKWKARALEAEQAVREMVVNGEDIGAAHSEHLEVTACNETLSIKVGIEILCYAVTIGRPYGNGDIKITDRDKFTEGLVSELQSESENGTTPVHTMLDEAVNMMLENGEEGVDFEDDDL
ncbi:hypothetical protein [Vreelandella sp. H-I2]